MNLFVYGTLTFPEIVFGLTHKTYRYESAILPHHFVSSIEGVPYPGLVKLEDASAQGLLLYDVDTKAMEILDVWETAEYTKQLVHVQSSQGIVEATVYLWAGSDISYHSWNREVFENSFLKLYLNNKIPRFLQTLDI